MRVVVYAIAKNEAAFVDRFVAATADADAVVVSDTGSTDGTVEMLRARGVTVHQIHVLPWRFDVARNAALALVDPKADVCVSLDIDEVIQPGWRRALERAWTPGTTRLGYKMWFAADGVGWINRIHARHGYTWRHICHEGLYPDPRMSELVKSAPGLEVRHLPNDLPRPSYLPMLKAAVDEEPDSKRMRFYYARELFYHGRWADSEAQFKSYVYDDGGRGADGMEAAYALRMCGFCATNTGRLDQAVTYLRWAVDRTPTRRDNYLSLAEAYIAVGKTARAHFALRHALDIKAQDPHFTDDPRAYQAYIYDLASWTADQEGLGLQAIAYIREAITRDPENRRLREDEAALLTHMDATRLSA